MGGRRTIKGKTFEWTDELDKRLIKLRNSGANNFSMEIELGVSRTTFVKRLKELDCYIPKRVGFGNNKKEEKNE